jgi:hypothetical protein
MFTGRQKIGAVVALALAFLISGCGPNQVLLANFNSDTVGGLPSTNQRVGTVAVDAGAGSVRVAAPPSGASTNWVEISHPNANTPQTGLQGKFNSFHGEGTYGLLSVLFIPTGCGVVTLQFEPAQNGPSDLLNFLHLDFMPDNTVRIDDGKASFGKFPRDQFFTVSVNLKVEAATTTAQMQLFGTGASGNLDYTVQSIFGNLSKQIGGVRFWMGFQHAGAYKVDDIVVNFRAP